MNELRNRFHKKEVVVNYPNTTKTYMELLKDFVKNTIDFYMSDITEPTQTDIMYWLN